MARTIKGDKVVDINKALKEKTKRKVKLTVLSNQAEIEDALAKETILTNNIYLDEASGHFKVNLNTMPWDEDRFKDDLQLKDYNNYLQIHKTVCDKLAKYDAEIDEVPDLDDYELQFQHKPIHPVRNWDETFDDIRLVSYLQRKGYDFNISHLQPAYKVVFSRQHRNMIQDYLENIYNRHYSPIDTENSTWYLDNWLVEYCGAEDTKINHIIGRKFILGAVCRIFDPGCKFDTVLVLEGIADIGKSMLVKQLALKPEWSTDGLKYLNNKDQIAYAASKWFVEWSEMTILSTHSFDAVKEFITYQEDSYRKPYTKTPVGYPRQFVIVGTTNKPVGYLTESQGNRRFWPVRVTKFDKSDNWIEKMYAEAMGVRKQLLEDYGRDDLYYDYTLTNEEKELLKPIQADRVSEDIDEPYIIKAIEWYKSNPDKLMPNERADFISLNRLESLASQIKMYEMGLTLKQQPISSDDSNIPDEDMALVIINEYSNQDRNIHKNTVQIMENLGYGSPFRTTVGGRNGAKVRGYKL